MHLGIPARRPVRGHYRFVVRVLVWQYTEPDQVTTLKPDLSGCFCHVFKRHCRGAGGSLAFHDGRIDRHRETTSRLADRGWESVRDLRFQPVGRAPGCTGETRPNPAGPWAHSRSADVDCASWLCDLEHGSRRPRQDVRSYAAHRPATPGFGRAKGWQSRPHPLNAHTQLIPHERRNPIVDW